MLTDHLTHLINSFCAAIDQYPYSPYEHSYLFFYTREMSSVRQPSEWGIGRVKALFAFLEFKVCLHFMLSKSNIGFLEEFAGSPNAAGGYVFGRCSLEEYTFHIVWISGLFYHLQLVTFCCLNPNSTNSSVQQNLRLDYILTP